MITLLLLVSALEATSRPSPVVNTDTNIDLTRLTIYGRELPECLDVTCRRTTQDIVWSCLATIFLCTWVAVHCNLPGSGDSGWERFRRQVVIMLCAVIAPEMMNYWAARQRVAAGRIVKEYNKQFHKNALLPDQSGWQILMDGIVKWFRGPDRNAPQVWTLTHGFFVQMGGFMLYENGEPVEVLTFDKLMRMAKQGKIEVPTISEEAINDKSKGDSLTKSFVVLQTSWFIVQCIARWAVGLSITDLEVITLAFAVLNIVTYILWWKKPQAVLVPVPIELKPQPLPEPSGQRSKLLDKAYRSDGDEDGPIDGCWLERTLGGAWDGLRLMKWPKWLRLVVVTPCRPLLWMLHRLMKFVGNNSGTSTSLTRVPMLYFDKRGSGRRAEVGFLVTAMVFGALHFIPWSSSFPSRTECWLWHASAIFITAQPLLAFVGGSVEVVLENMKANTVIYRLVKVLVYDPMRVFAVIGIPFYVSARLTLIVLAFTMLRALPPAAYRNVEWTTFVPHV